MYRSPFGILDNPLTSGNDVQHKRPSSASATTRRTKSTAVNAIESSDGNHQPISFTEMARERYKDVIHDVPIVDTGTGRVRPRSAGAIRVTNRFSSNRTPEQRIDIHEEHHGDDSIDMLTGSLSKTQLLPKTSDEPAIDGVDGQQEDHHVNKQKKKKTSLTAKQGKKATKVINNVELSQEEWEKIFAKYNLPGIDEVKFNFLRKGTGFTTKFDFLGKQQLEKSMEKQRSVEQLLRSDSAPYLRPPSANTTFRQSATTGSTAVKSETEIDAMMQEFFPSSSSRHLPNYDNQPRHQSPYSGLQRSINVESNESRYLREYSKKKKQEDQEFAQLLEKELAVESQHLQRCIQECNEFCEYLGKDFSYQYRDYRSVRKVSSNFGNASAQPGQNGIRIITVDKFHSDHAALLKEFKTFSKYHSRQSLDTAKPRDSAHFIGVDDLFQQAKKMEGESESKKIVNNGASKMNTNYNNNQNSKEDTDRRQSNVVHYNELKRRNETIAMQLQIMQEYDDLHKLLTCQLDEIQRKGWNLHYKTLFLSNFST